MLNVTFNYKSILALRSMQENNMSNIHIFKDKNLISKCELNHLFHIAIIVEIFYTLPLWSNIPADIYLMLLLLFQPDISRVKYYRY